MNKIFELLSCSQGAIASLKLFGHVTATTRPKCALHTETTCVLGFRARSKPCIFAWKCSEHEDMRRSTVTMTCTSEIVTFGFSNLYPCFPKTMSSRVSLRPGISPNNSLLQSWKRKGMIGWKGGGGGGRGGGGWYKKPAHVLIVVKIYMWCWILFHGTKQAKQVTATRTGLNQLVTEFSGNINKLKLRD